VATVNWTTVIVALITGLPAIIAAIFAAKSHGKLKTPSGDNIGHVVERTHDLAAANMGLLMHKNGPTRDATPADKQDLRNVEPQVAESP
jgi:hypothetical protein